MASKTFVTVRQIEVKTGLSASTIGYYTATGLIHSSRRKGTARLYPARSTLEKLKQIRALRNRGYSLRAIKDNLDDSRE